MTTVRMLTALSLVILVILALPDLAMSATPLIVGDDTPGSCTEMALKHTLLIAETVGGATILFACGPGPVTIALTEPTTEVFGQPVMLKLPNNTMLDGGNLITLDGTHTGTTAFVDRDTTVVLKRLTIINGRGPHGGGGIINFGTLTIDRSTLSGNFAVLGGGIWNDGALAVRKSIFEGNSAFFSGGGIFNNSDSATLTVEDSTFHDNLAVDFGGGIFGGMVTINRSTFSENTALLSGGAIVGTVTVNRSTFSRNAAVWYGGAIFGDGTIRNSTFESNSTVLAGGAAFGDSLTIDRSVFSSNSAEWGGGIFNVGSLTIEESRFFGNSAEWGGGIFNVGSLTIDRSIITQNTANSVGGGIYVCVEGQAIPEAALPAPSEPCHGTLTLDERTSVAKNTPDNIFP